MPDVAPEPGAVFGLEAERLRTSVEWLTAGDRVVAATLVETLGSSPFTVGATMLVRDDLTIEGSVSGGCVEGALVEVAESVLAGEPPQLRTYGISDEQAAGVGLMCGGTVRVFVRELSQDAPVLRAAASANADGKPAVIATLIDGPGLGRSIALADGQPVGSFGLDARLDHVVRRDMLGCVLHGTSRLRHYGLAGQVMNREQSAFIHSFAAPPQLIIVGAIDFSVATARIAKVLGYRVTICDAREPFISGSKFAIADEVAVQWPHKLLASKELGPRDAVLVFTHDEKFDEPALLAAAATGAGYIGALGSRRVQADRRRRLREAGMSDEDLARIAGPCGLDIGALTPEETAVSILAEVIAKSTGRAGQSLVETSAPIHDDSPSPVAADSFE